MTVPASWSLEKGIHEPTDTINIPRLHVSALHAPISLHNNTQGYCLSSAHVTPTLCQKQGGTGYAKEGYNNVIGSVVDRFRVG